MRKMIFLAHVSLDGYMATTTGDFSWTKFEDDLQQAVHSLHQRVDAAVFGRNTYQMMEYYWPKVLADPSSEGTTLEHAQWLDTHTKYVVSTTLDKVTWKNTVAIRDNLAEEFEKIKKQPGKDLWLLGSARLAQTLIRLGLVDEYWLNVYPVILGGGIPFAAGLDHLKHLTLLEARTYKGGIVATRYENLPTAASQPVVPVGEEADRSMGD